MLQVCFEGCSGAFVGHDQAVRRTGRISEALHSCSAPCASDDLQTSRIELDFVARVSATTSTFDSRFRVSRYNDIRGHHTLMLSTSYLIGYQLFCRALSWPHRIYESSFLSI